MKSYKINSEFDFGKFKGRTLKEVVELEPSYLNWCALKVEFFYMSNETREELKKIKKDFLSSEGDVRLEVKYENWVIEKMSNLPDDFEAWVDEDPNYQEYGGAYGFDDDTINTAFEGDPENYWNID